MIQPTKATGVKNVFFSCFLTIIVTSISPVTFGLYFSCLPQISEFFTTDTRFYPQLVFLPYILGLTISQIVYGPLSDFYGRKPIILIGLSIFIIGSLLNFMSTSVTIFMGARFIQGVGAGYTNPICRALQRDLFKEGVQYFVWGSYVTMILSLVSITSPLVGSYILEVYSKNFYVIILSITIYALCIFCTVYLIMSETNCSKISGTFSWHKCYIKSLKIFKNRQFIKLAVCGGLFYAAEITYASLSSVVFQVELKWSLIHYGSRAMIIMSGFFCGCLISSQLNKSFSFYSNVLFGFAILFFSEFSTMYLLLTNKLSTYILMFTMWLFMLASGVISSNLSLKAISLFKKDLGLAASLYCSFQLVFAFLAIIISWGLSIQRLSEMILFLLIIALVTFFYLFNSVNIVRLITSLSKY